MEDVKWLLRKCGLLILLLLIFVIVGVICWGKMHEEEQKAVSYTHLISAMVSNPRFADAIKAKIGSAVDTNDLEKQLEALQAQLRQTLGTKARLERQMDGLDVNDPYYDRKISDLQRRYDEQLSLIHILGSFGASSGRLPDYRLRYSEKSLQRHPEPSGV